MRKSLILSTVLAGLAATSALAGITVGAPLGTDDAAITQKLTDAGYAVTRIEREDDEIEITATRDGRKYEIELNRNGEVREIELDD